MKEEERLTERLAKIHFLFSCFAINLLLILTSSSGLLSLIPLSFTRTRRGCEVRIRNGTRRLMSVLQLGDFIISDLGISCHLVHGSSSPTPFRRPKGPEWEKMVNETDRSRSFHPRLFPHSYRPCSSTSLLLITSSHSIPSIHSVNEVNRE